VRDICIHITGALTQPAQPTQVSPTATFILPEIYSGFRMSEADNRDVFARLAGLLRASPRIICIVGAGLSAPSGLATWRGTNGLWNDNDIKSLASPKRFTDDPVTVWSFYGERLLQSLAAQPNAAHHALAGLASWHDRWLTVNQNVDGTKELIKLKTFDALNYDRSS